MTATASAEQNPAYVAFTLFLCFERNERRTTVRIVSVITELAPAGAERMLADLVRGQIAHGHEARVVSLCPEPEDSSVADDLRSAGAEVVFLGARKTSFLSLPFRLRRAIRGFRPDVAHSHLMHANLASRIALAGTGIPLVNTIHISERRPGKGVFFRLDRMTFRLADVATAVSEAAARHHERMCGLPTGTIRVVSNGIDPVDPASEQVIRAFVDECGLGPCSCLLASVGRLDRQKGYDRLLSRLPALSARIPKGEIWGLAIFGEGPERAALEAQARALPCENILVVLPGRFAGAASLTAGFDVFLMPSRSEGCPLALLEAMSLGLPVVTSDADSLPELCRNYTGFSACLSFEEDADGTWFAEAVVRAAESGRSLPCILTTKEEMIEQYETIYHQLTTGDRSDA